MKPITEQYYQKRMKEIRRDNIYKERYAKIKAEKNKYKSKLKLPSTSKLIAVYLFVILNVVLIYAMIAMWVFSDFSYLGVLITDVAGQVVTYLIYTKKATIENTVGGITYELAMRDDDKTYEDTNG